LKIFNFSPAWSLWVLVQRLPVVSSFLLQRGRNGSWVSRSGTKRQLKNFFARQFDFFRDFHFLRDSHDTHDTTRIHTSNLPFLLRSVVLPFSSFLKLPSLFYSFTRVYYRLTPRKKRTPTARSAASTRNTKSRSTNPARPQTLPRASDDTTENSAVSVARQSQFSTRKLRQQRRLPCDWSAKFAKPKHTSASNAASLSSWVPRKLRVVTSIKFVVLKPMCILILLI